jgi:hypothetical protein
MTRSSEPIDLEYPIVNSSSPDPHDIPSWMHGLTKIQPKVYTNTEDTRTGLQITFYSKDKDKLKQKDAVTDSEKLAETLGYYPDGCREIQNGIRKNGIWWTRTIKYRNRKNWLEKQRA